MNERLEQCILYNVFGHLTHSCPKNQGKQHTKKTGRIYAPIAEIPNVVAEAIAEAIAVAAATPKLQPKNSNGFVMTRISEY